MADAKKYDGDKVRLDLFPWRAFVETCRVLTIGAAVYDVGNWKSGPGFKYSRLGAAILRHFVPWALGEDFDRKSGRHHLAHLMCEVGFALEQVLSGHGIDDRKESQIWDIAQIPDMMMDPVEMEEARKLRAEMEAKTNVKS